MSTSLVLAVVAVVVLAVLVVVARKTCQTNDKYPLNRMVLFFEKETENELRVGAACEKKMKTSSKIRRVKDIISVRAIKRRKR